MIFNIGFYSDGLTYRGTTIAMFHYAFFNKTILRNHSLVFTKRYSPYIRDLDLDVYNKFSSAFKVVYVNNISDVEVWCKGNNVKLQLLYTINEGIKNAFRNCAFDPSIVKYTFNHCVFELNEAERQFSTYYVGISDFISPELNLPHIVHLEKPNKITDLRIKYKIPENATVFGRYGGSSEFNIQFVCQAVKEVVNSTSDIYFLMASTYMFYKHPKIIYIERLHSDKEKCDFISACDAMLHARERGETFGLSIGEFSIMNKPVITYSESPEKQHYFNLGEKAILYKDKDELVNILTSWKKDSTKEWNCFQKYEPEAVMKIFQQFIDGSFA